MKHARILGGALAVGALLACEGRHGASEPPPPSPAPTAPSAATVSPSPEAALGAMDHRTPVPLLPMMANHQKQNMRDHLVAVQEIVAALGAGDFQAVEKSAGRIGYSEQMGAMCNHMGAGAPGFTEQALHFHHTADRIGDAARKRDASSVLRALTDTLATCTTCHQTFRQQVVDEPTWASMTKTAAP